MKSFVMIALLSLTSLLSMRAHAQEFFYTYPYAIPEPSVSEFRVWSLGVLKSDQTTRFDSSKVSKQQEHFEAIEFEKALSPQLSLAGYMDFLGRPSSSFHYGGLRAEARYRFGNRADHFFDTALYAEYVVPRKGDFDEGERVETKLLLEKIIGDFDLRLNPGFSKETAITPAEGLNVTSAISFGWIRHAAFQPAIELYSEYGELAAPDSLDQTREMAVIAVNSFLNSDWSLQASYGHGLTNKTDLDVAQLILTFEPAPSYAVASH